MPAVQKKKKSASPDVFRTQEVLQEDYHRAGSQLDDIISIPKRTEAVDLAQNTSPMEAAQKQEETQEQINPVSQKAEPAEQAKDPILAVIDINEESFNGIKALYEEKLHKLMDEVEGPISNREKFQILFDILKKDGELEIKYELGEGRETRSPQQVLDAKAADCNEFALLFAVCAKKLEIEVKDVRMLVMDVHLQVGKSPGHAALITSKEGSYLIDPAYLDKVNVFHPQDPENVKSAEIRDFYTQDPTGARIVGITITEKAADLGEMYAVNLMETVGTYETRIGGAQGSEKDELRLKIVGVLERAHEADSNKLPAQVKLMSHYTVLADEAFEKAESAERKEVKQRYYELSKHYCEKAVRLYEKCKSQYIGKERDSDIIEIKKNAYHVHDVLSKIHDTANDEGAVLSEFDEMIKMAPERVDAYSNKISFLYNRAVKENKIGDISKEEKYLRSARKAGEFALKSLKGDYFATRTIQAQIKKIDTQLQRFEDKE